ncbi:DUF5916 domain-containing protein [Candidatus Latescibacterota bacterium]
MHSHASLLCLAATVLIATHAHAAAPEARAVRLDSSPPRIDGVLDDDAWATAPLHEGFRQRDPDEGLPASERTAFQVAYDEQALYVAVHCWDRDPGAIISRLTRRDGESEADRVTVSLDPRRDLQTGYWFTVYASGSVMDGVYSSDQNQDNAWDGVWEVETAIHDQGWSAEYRIPYHVLRFSPAEEYEWGLNVGRHIVRKQEHDQWSLIRRGDTGLVSRFGLLRGIEGIHPSLQLEVLPFGMGRAIVDGGEDYSGNVGVDVRYGVTSGISLNATVNPDFGQVEADPATLNLTAFEDFYPERGPFFVEGAAIFGSQDYDVFHSRRIGRQPGYLLPEDAEEVDRPDATTILGAVKLTGKTEGKTTFGVLDAVTSREHASYQQPDVGGWTETDGELVEPLTNYFVGRVQQDILDGTSTTGFLATAVHREDAPSAYVGALDWDLRFRQDTYTLSGSLVGSRTGESDDRQSGYIGHLEADKRGGWLEAEAGVAALSRHVDLNDLGYLRRGDLVRSWSEVILFRHNPIGSFQRFDTSISGEALWNYDGTRLGTGFGCSTWGDLKSYWSLHLHFGRDFGANDDDDVWRGGPVIKSLAESWVHAQVETDDRRVVSFTVRPEMRRHDGGRSWTRGFRVGMVVQPLPSLWFFVEPEYSRRLNDAQWVEAIEEGGGGQPAVHQVYGELESQVLDLTTRARVSFTPELSLELYLQPFIAIGDYRSHKELVAPGTYRFQPYDLGENRDFHQRSLQSNLVLRWEFRPGSLLYAVWSQSRNADLVDVTDEDLELNPLSRLGSSFTDKGTNLFLVKVSYWYGR